MQEYKDYLQCFNEYKNNNLINITASTQIKVFPISIFPQIQLAKPIRTNSFEGFLMELLKALWTQPC